MKKIKSLIMLFLVYVLLISTSACWLFSPFAYSGDALELYTVAVNNIFGASGYASNGEVAFDPYIKIIETDAYGRTLFYYDEGLSCYDKDFQYDDAHKNYYYAVLIMQKANDGFVYYYEDVCFEIHLVLDVKLFEIDEEVKRKDFSHLKESNDWGKPMNEDKCVKKRTTTRNKGVLDISEKTFKQITREYATIIGDKGNDTIYRFDLYSTSDCYGRELYYVWGVSRDVYGEGISPTSTSQYFDFAIIFNPDGSYNKNTCIIEIQDIINFKEELILFKIKNQWNQPYTS